jgi:hypothetical protein
MSAARTDLLGLWRLVSAYREYLDSGETHELLGPAPTGFLLLAPGGRMIALLTDTSRESGDDPSSLFRGLMGYSGRYHVEDDRFITDVDVAWHPDWLGTKQERFFRIEGDDLHIRSAEQIHPAFPGRVGRGVLRWKREEAFAVAPPASTLAGDSRPAVRTAIRSMDEAKAGLVGRGRTLLSDGRQPVRVAHDGVPAGVNVSQRVLRFSCGCALYSHVSSPDAVAKPALCDLDRDLFTR